MTTEISTPLLIDGQERAASATFPVYDPAANGTVIGHAAAASADDALDAVAAANQAWPAWAALSAAERTA
ncbi:MAG: aldehyde dehydrogenase family protein, partial [Trebonia sp.]